MEYYSQAYCKNCNYWRPVHRKVRRRGLLLRIVLPAPEEIDDWRCQICEAMVELGDESPPESRQPYPHIKR